MRDQISRDLNTVMRALKKLSLVYPLLGMQALYSVSIPVLNPFAGFQVQELEQKLTAGSQA